MIWFLGYVAVAGIVTAVGARYLHGPQNLTLWILQLVMGWILLPGVCVATFMEWAEDVEF